MKKKISVSIDEETLRKILDSVSNGRFRNKSHAIEYAVNNLGEK